MPKTKISEFSATPANNTDIDSINIAEGCAPSGINDAIRELMAQLKDFQTGAVGDSFNGPVGTTTAAAGAFTTLSSTGNTTLGDASGDSVTINGTATFANANPTLSAGTANGVAYLNGSKVLTSGSALTFNGTRFSTYVTSNSNQNIARFGVQNTANTDDAFLDIYADAANNLVTLDSTGNNAGLLAFNLGGSEQMRLTSTGLGIGTSSPAQKLHVDQTSTGSVWAKISNGSNASGAAAGVLFGSDGGDLGAISILSSGNSPANALFLRSLSTNPLVFGTNNAEKMRLDSSGNLGLGVTPSAWATYKAIDILGFASFSSYNGNEADMSTNAYFNSGWKYKNTGAATLYQQDAGVHRWQYAPSGTAGNAITFTQAMTLDASGNLLVGTTSPTYSASGRGLVEINGSSTSLLALKTGGSAAGYVYHDGTEMSVVNTKAGSLQLTTNGSERARIDSSGNLLVGTTSVISAGKYSSSFNGSVSNGIILQTTLASSGSTFIGFINSAGSSIGSINQNATSTVIYNTSSDYRLKNITGALTGYKERLMSLQPKQGTWKADGSEFRGFLAHEFANPYRASVTGEKDAVDDDGKPIYQGMQASSSEVMADLVAMVNELITENASLKARLDAANL